MPDWTWLVFAAVFGAVSALSVPLALLIYFVRPLEKKTQTPEDYSLPITLPIVSNIDYFYKLLTIVPFSQRLIYRGDVQVYLMVMNYFYFKTKSFCY